MKTTHYYVPIGTRKVSISEEMDRLSEGAAQDWKHFNSVSLD